MKGLVLDYHSTATRDIVMTLRELGHDITSWNLSEHSWTFGEKKSNVRLLDSLPLSSYDLGVGKTFWNLHSEELDSYDFFITGHTPCLSLLFSETTKPVVVCITTRYEHPFTGSEDLWKRFNDYLTVGYERGRLHFVANNFYDANYFFHYTGIMPRVIQSICHYHEGLWKKSVDDLVLYSKLRVNMNGVKDIKAQGRYTWETWYSHAGVFCIPYQVSTMSGFEFSAAGMPVIYPGIDETLELRKKFPGQVLSEVSWRCVSQQYANNAYKHMATYGELPSPNDLDDDSMRAWLKYSDSYTPWLDNVVGNKSGMKFENKKKYFVESWQDVIKKL